MSADHPAPTTPSPEGMLTLAEIDAALKVCEAATPGPWHLHHRHVLAGPESDEIDGLGWDWTDGASPPDPQLRGAFSRFSDVRFLMLARTLLPRAILNLKSLLKRAPEVGEVVEENERWRSMREKLHEWSRTLPDEIRGPFAALCRESKCPCFCGCHVTDVGEWKGADPARIAAEEKLGT